MSRVFDRGNAELNAFVRELVDPQANDHILEIGFGTGRLLHELAATVKDGIVEGVDFSEAMVLQAQKNNARLMSDGRVSFRQGAFEDMVWTDSSFDTVCSVNTVYFWKNPLDTAQKIRRLLKAGGKLVLGFGDKAELGRKPLSADVFNLYTPEEVVFFLRQSGFSGAIYNRKRQGSAHILHCVVAEK
ncbi:class I SAM-dependent methyltransferase [Desulfovibrio mangrovi]|uniref:class I SAM-dependent methyltransferase n=1 Tax=Desulfovibrio mangrovi TaxID=2976983 RepID=UPI002246A7CC|nr:class I SAM-dependent methyltransferase [Desulfovibrio mangrovi]UZP67966.1 class I SAM-dependent methyltransferase [Desulfovibrio mangrovi]